MTVDSKQAAAVLLRRISQSVLLTIAMLFALPAASQNAINRASVTPPAGVTNPGTSCNNPGQTFAAGVCTALDSDPIQPRLTLIKTVTNDQGGGALPAAWTLTASGPSSISGITGAAAVTNASVNVGNYTLSESGGPAGYTAGTFSCVLNGGAALVSNSLTLAAGDNATCTINNNDQPATLTLIKTVTNDNRGARTINDFPLTATGPSTITGVSGSATVTNAAVNSGVYALSEINRADYAAGAWTCTGALWRGAN